MRACASAEIEIALHCFVISTICSNTIQRSFCQTKFYGNVFHCAILWQIQHRIRAHIFAIDRKKYLEFAVVWGLLLLLFMLMLMLLIVFRLFYFCFCLYAIRLSAIFRLSKLGIKTIRKWSAKNSRSVPKDNLLFHEIKKKCKQFSYVSF